MLAHADIAVAEKRERTRSCFGIGDEFVADPPDRQEVAWIRGIRFNIAPQTYDEVVNRASIGVFVQIPYLLQNGFTRNRVADVRDQEAQQIGFHQRQLKTLVAHVQTQMLEIHELVTEPERRGWVRRW